MKHIKQEVVWYPNYRPIKDICQDMQMWIDDGWRVHTCLNKSSEVLVVYEKEELVE